MSWDFSEQALYLLLVKEIKYHYFWFAIWEKTTLTYFNILWTTDWIFRVKYLGIHSTHLAPCNEFIHCPQKKMLGDTYAMQIQKKKTPNFWSFGRCTNSCWANIPAEKYRQKYCLFPMQIPFLLEFQSVLKSLCQDNCVHMWYAEGCPSEMPHPTPGNLCLCHHACRRYLAGGVKLRTER